MEWEVGREKRSEGGKHKQTIDYSRSSVTDNQTKRLAGSHLFHFISNLLPRFLGGGDGSVLAPLLLYLKTHGWDVNMCTFTSTQLTLRPLNLLIAESLLASLPPCLSLLGSMMEHVLLCIYGRMPPRRWRMGRLRWLLDIHFNEWATSQTYYPRDIVRKRYWAWWCCCCYLCSSAAQVVSGPV